MPIVIKSIKTGTPSLYDVFPAISEINNSIDPINNMFSVVRITSSQF